MAKTHGLANLDTLSDGHLEHLISNQCLSVFEASVMFGEAEWAFAVGTLERLLDERKQRKVRSSA